MKNFYLMMLMLFAATTFLLAQEAQEPDIDLVEEQINDNGGERIGIGGGTVVIEGSGGAGGSQAITIKTRMPKEGKIRNKNFELMWSGKPNNSYVVTIAENGFEGSSPVWEQSVRGNAMIVPIESIALMESKKYYLQVSEAEHRSNVSVKAFFQITNESFYDEVVKITENMEDYQRGSHVKKVVMKAIAFEQNGLNYEALKAYQTYMFADKDDILLRNIRDKFMKRKGIDL